MDADANANTDAGGSTIALPERCSGELKKVLILFLFFHENIMRILLSGAKINLYTVNFRK